METSNGLHLLLAYGIGFLSAIVCIIPPFHCNRGYQPKRPSKADIKKTNEFLAHAKPKKSGVPPLVKVVKWKEERNEAKHEGTI